ncbi:alpha/beta hydrolase [Caryophanon tenue]|uniref:Enterochelin esterase n=1 Tax=Caryophanon tenue TaxID=33978 RepID=A0A1C0YK14_9BACL|nr:alpha/beta hydrolase-fold protein [Caryophanon tenue]OCS87484.1 hypothetical protein A6M13_09245 [Caryophanon tenue]
MEKGSVKEIDFYSDALQEELKLLIYIPPNFTPLVKHSVLIASDGRDYFQLGRIPRLADELHNDYEIENLIIVGVPYKNAKDRQRKYIATGDLFEAYTRFLAHELVPYLDEEFPTLQMGQGRGLIGDSMAATISLLTALKYPNLFGKVIMQSPYVDDYTMEATRNFTQVDALSIYHIAGKREDQVVTTDKTIKDFITPNRQLHALMKENGYDVFYEEFDGNHTWKYWQPDLRRALVENFS